MEIGWEDMESIGTSGGLLWTRWWIFGFHKRRGIFWLSGQL